MNTYNCGMYFIHHTSCSPYTKYTHFYLVLFFWTNKQKNNSISIFENKYPVLKAFSLRILWYQNTKGENSKKKLSKVTPFLHATLPLGKILQLSHIPVYFIRRLFFYPFFSGERKTNNNKIKNKTWKVGQFFP